MLPSQRGDMRTLARQAGITPVIQPVGPGSAHTRQLVGPAVPLRAVTMTAAPASTPSRRKGSGQGAGTPGRPAGRRGRRTPAARRCRRFGR